MQLFKEKGYKNVSVDEIVQACNSSKGSFYHHFKSKAEILNEHFALADKYYEQLYNELPTQLTPKGRLQLFLENVFIYLEETFGREFLSVVYSTSLESEAHLYFRNPNRKLFMLFEALIAEVIEASTTKPSLSIKQLKLAFIQLDGGHLLLVYFPGRSVSPGKWCKCTRAFFKWFFLKVTLKINKGQSQHLGLSSTFQVILCSLQEEI